MRPRAVRVVWAATALLLAYTGVLAAAAQPDPRAEPPDEERVLNTLLPDVALTTSLGRQTRLSELSAGQPLLFTFVFTRCAGVCSPFLRSWRAADASVANRSAFRRLVISFDARDSIDDMAALAAHVGADRDTAWTFAVAAPADVHRLADAAGFWYDWDEARQQFDHPAMLAGVRNGRLVRLLVGGAVSTRRLDELVRETSGVFVASYPLPGRVRFRCVKFDAASGRATLDWGFALLLVPIASTSGATFAIFVAGARARRRQRSHFMFEASHT